VEVVDIGFPGASVGAVHSQARLLDALLVSSWLPRRERFSNKGSFGTTVVVAGSAGMLGAAALCSRASLRAGCGLTRLIVAESLLAAANSMTLEVICRPGAGSPAGTLSLDAMETIVKETSRARALAVGPGLTTGPEITALVAALIPAVDCPMVIDADALNILASHLEILDGLRAPAVLTPHPGEMARLMGVTPADVQADRIGMARRLSRERNVVVVLKGAWTVVAEPSGSILLNSTGNAGLATAGTGDVLTGTIAGLLAQGLAPFEAAGCGVYLHGLAGDQVAALKGDAGLMASDLLDELPRARARVVE
jgi:ADP-dependent NAD(P)H-hydrate dehydratase / NAD(P)H-hydrate epimerase